MAHLDNLGLSKKINKKFQNQDLDKSSEEIGDSYVKRISWMKFVYEIVEFCESNGIEISKATDEHGLPGKLEIYLTDSVKRIDYIIVSQEYSTDRGYRVSGDKFKKFVKLSINEIEGFFYPEIAYFKYKDNGLADYDRYHGPVLVNAPRVVPGDIDMDNYKNGDKILLPKNHFYEITSFAAKNICCLLKDLSTLTKICVEKYKRTNLTFSSFKRLLEKNISKEFIPSYHSIENGKFYYDYKFWNTIVEGKNSNNSGIDLDSKLDTRLERVKEYVLTESDLGLNKKIQKKYDDKSVEDTIEEINILDKEGFEEALVKKFSESPIVERFEGSLAEYNTTRITLKNQWRIEDNHVWVIIQNSKFMLHFVIECNGFTTVYFPIGNAESLIDYVEKDKVKPDYGWRKKLFSECWLDFTYKNVQDALQFVESYANGSIDSSWYDESAIYRALSESKVTLGLNKKVQAKHKSKDSIVNVAEKLDPETFKNLAKETLCEIQGVNQMLQAGILSDEDTVYFGLDCTSILYFFSREPSKEGLHGAPFLKIYNYHDAEKAKFSLYFSTKHEEEDVGIETMHQFGADNKVDRYTPDDSLKFDLSYDNLTMLATWLKGEIMSISKINESQTNLGISSKVKKRFDKKDPVSNISETLPPEKFIEAYFDRVRKDIQEHVSDTCKFAYHHQHINLTSSQNFAMNLDVSGGYFYIGIQKYDYQDNEWLINRVAYNSDKFITCAFEEKDADKTDVVYLPNRFSEGHSIKYRLTTTMIDSIVKWMIKDSGCEAIANIPLTEKYLNLGLSSKVRKRFDDKDPISEVTILDKDDFFTFCDRVFSESEFVTDTKKGIYNEKRDWDFLYVHFMTPKRYSSTIYIRVEDGGSNFCAYGVIESAEVYFPIGRMQLIRETLLTETDLTDGEIQSIINEKTHFSLTYENIIKAREFFEKLIKDGNPENWKFTDTIDDLLKRTKIINENKLGLNKKIQKKFNDTDAVENVSIMDESTFKEFAIEYINSHTKYEFLHEVSKDLRYDKLYKVSVMRFWNYEFRKGLSVFVNDSIFAIISIDGKWNNYSDCFNFGERTIPAADKMFNVFCKLENKDSYTLTPKNLKEEVKICADETLMINESDLGLNKKIQKKFNDNVEDKAVEISEMTFMEFWEEAKDRFERISEELGGGDVRFYPSVEDPEMRKLCRDENWISVSFKNVGRFVIVAKSKYQNYPKYKNLLEDSFRLYLSYTLNPSERCYEHNEINFRGGSSHIVNPDKDTEWYFKMNYYNLDKAIEWMREQITDNSNEDRLVQME